jgi:hypothetical protein
MADTQKIHQLISTIQAHEYAFNMRAWVENSEYDEDDAEIFQSGESIEAPYECGFALCLGGWQMLLDGYEIIWSEEDRDFGFFKDGHFIGNDYVVGELAAKSLGIPTPKHCSDNHVFMMTNWPTDSIFNALKLLADGETMMDAIHKSVPSEEEDWISEE